MKRRHLLAGATAALASLKAQTGLTQEADANAALTHDVYTGDFPPTNYGQTHAAIEATIQEVVERVFRDEDGILRSGVNGTTMQPLTNADVKDRPNGKGAYTEHSAMPDALKAVWLNYENAGQASGSYLVALCLKYEVTRDPKVRELARRTVNAIVLLWNNAAPPRRPQASAAVAGAGFPNPTAASAK